MRRYHHEKIRLWVYLGYQHNQRSKKLFAGNEIPQEGEILELAVVKSETTDDSCALVLKLHSVQK
ncbi:hypothetical protein CXH12_02320 [Citrobacter portucalensis]|nr:hypothetical protein CXH12_02320 [Citrobacter portucalensis]